MKKIILHKAGAAILFSAAMATAQVPPTINTLPHPSTPSLVSIESQARTGARLRRDPLPVLSGADRRRIEALRAPNPDDLAKYEDFLGRKGTGIFRLFPDFACESKSLVRVDGDCANQVSGASSHSFRGRTTSHDLRFQGGDLIAEGFFSLPMMVSLGNTDLQNVTLASDGVRFLTAYEPASMFEAVKEEYSLFRNGQKAGDFVYINRIKPVDDHTYAIRIIAYDIGNTVGKRLRRDHLTGKNPQKTRMFSMLRYDNRKDMIIAFRVIRRDDDGNISILWKELSKKSAPKIVFDDRQEFSDFK